VNIGELITIVRKDYLKDKKHGGLWGKKFMLRSFTEAHRQACNRQFFIFDDSSQEYTELRLIDGQSVYSVNSKINKIEEVLLDDVVLSRCSKEELTRIRPLWRTETGIKEKQVTYLMRGHSMRVIPAPTASLDATYVEAVQPSIGITIDETWWDTVNLLLFKYDGINWVASPAATLGILNLEVYRLPAKDFISTSDIPEIPDEFHRDLIYWVLHEAYKKQDSDAFNQERSDYFLSKFTEAFGDYVSSEVRLNQMQQPSSLFLHPTPYDVKMHNNKSADEWFD
jgi:hypothetical protein